MDDQEGRARLVRR
eukprot:ctg_7002.g566